MQTNQQSFLEADHEVGDRVIVHGKQGVIRSFSGDGVRVEIEFRDLDGGTFKRWHHRDELPPLDVLQPEVETVATSEPEVQAQPVVVASKVERETLMHEIKVGDTAESDAEIAKRENEGWRVDQIDTLMAWDHARGSLVVMRVVTMKRYKKVEVSEPVAEATVDLNKKPSANEMAREVEAELVAMDMSQAVFGLNAKPIEELTFAEAVKTCDASIIKEVSNRIAYGKAKTTYEAGQDAMRFGKQPIRLIHPVLNPGA